MSDGERRPAKRRTEGGGGATDRSTAVDVLGGDGASLLDAVDNLLNHGVVLEGDLVLGLADVDLVYLRLSTLLAAADRILGRAPEPSAPLPSVRQAAPYPPAPPPRAEGAELASSRAEEDPVSSPATEPAGEPLRPDPEGAPGDLPAPPRWNAAAEDVERSVARLVLALVEFLRKLMERQAIRRMEEDTLTEAEVERLGRALMRLEETVHDMASRFGLSPEDLNLDLGPLGRLT